MTLFGSDCLLWILMMFYYKYNFSELNGNCWFLWSINQIDKNYHHWALVYMSYEQVAKGPRSLKGLVKLWTICVKLVLPGLQIDSKADHNPHANWYWWKYVFYAITFMLWLISRLWLKIAIIWQILAIFGLFWQIFCSTDSIYAYFKLEMHQ